MIYYNKIINNLSQKGVMKNQLIKKFQNIKDRGI